MIEEKQVVFCKIKKFWDFGIPFFYLGSNQFEIQLQRIYDIRNCACGCDVANVVGHHQDLVTFQQGDQGLPERLIGQELTEIIHLLDFLIRPQMIKSCVQSVDEHSKVSNKQQNMLHAYNFTRIHKHCLT